MRSKRTAQRLRSLAEVVEDYRAHHRHHNTGERRWFQLQRSFREAIHRAGRAEGPGGKRLSHQRRLSRETLRRCEATLLSAERDLQRARAFDELYALVERLIADIHGVGELMVYDTAIRLGAKLGLEPREIYLHAGTRQGAKALGFDGRARSIRRASLPEVLRNLPASELEDIFCIYCDDLGRLAKSGMKQCIADENRKTMPAAFRHLKGLDAARRLRRPC